MKKILWPFLLFAACATTHPTPAPVPNPAPIPIPVPKPPPTPDPTPVTPGSDWSPYFQHQIDSCIADNISILYIPQGRYLCLEPLILSNWSAAQGYYAAFSLIVQGTSTFAGADGSGTILDFTQMTSGFGIGIQAGKGVEIHGIKLIGAFAPPLVNAYQFYNSTLQNFTDGKCRDSRFSPYAAISIDPFGPSIPTDSGYAGFGSFYRGSTNGSTGTVIEDCYLTNWIIGIITSPNGQTKNAELTIADKIQFGNMKICVAGCQDQEKMNRVSNVMCWGVVHTCFVLGLYGAGSIGNWNLDHWNIAGYTNEIIYDNESGYYPSYLDHIYAESLGRLGTWYSINGSTLSNSSINFAGYQEAGSYTEGMISGYGVTFSGCQLRIYGQYIPSTAQGTPITILTGSGSNIFHFRDCAFDAVPFYPQNYAYGYTDFSNCTISQGYQILNPLAPQKVNAFAYPSDMAARAVPIDPQTHRLTGVIATDSTIVSGEPIVGTYNYVDYKIVGIATPVSGGFILSYQPASVDSTKAYSLYHWRTIMR
jgi:hypothetical protein